MSRLRSLCYYALPVTVLAFVAASPALAADSAVDISQLQNFIQNIINILVVLAGLLATGFLVWGGIRYITSTGNPQHLDGAKHTIIYAGIGLAIAIGAFALSSIVSQLAVKAFN